MKILLLAILCFLVAFIEAYWCDMVFHKELFDKKIWIEVILFAVVMLILLVLKLKNK